MGQCYSCQANSGRGPYSPNADMSTRPITQGRPSGLGSNRTANPSYHYKKVPQYNGQGQPRRNSNENPEDRAALAIIDDNSPVSRPKSVKTEYNTNLNRFGFRPSNKLGKSDSNSNVMTISSDSLDNVVDIDVVKKKEQTKYGSERSPRPRSYEHPESRNWKMIDDSSTTDSRSVSTQGTQGTQEASDANGNGHSQVKTDRTSLASKLRSGDKKPGQTIGTPTNKSLVKSGKVPTAKMSPARDRWVRAEAAEPEGRQSSPVGGRNHSSTKSPAVDQTQRPKSSLQEPSQSRLMTRARGWFNSYGQRSGQQENKNKPEDNKKIKSGLSRLKQSKVQTAEKDSVEEVKKPVPAISPVTPESSDPSFDESERGRIESNMKDSFTKDSGIGSDSLEAQDLITRDPQPHKPALVKKDSMDAGSVCSLNSDDLMLDLDINLDEDLMGASTSTLEKSSFLNSSQVSSVTPMRNISLEAGRPYSTPHRERAGSQGSDVGHPGDGMVTNKPPVRPGSLLRRHTESTISHPRSNSWKEERAKNSINEALTELSALIETSPSPSSSQTEAPGIQRRNPRLQRSNRPASFPGPSLSGGAVGGTEEVRSPLKPPKTGPSLGDDDQLFMDAFNYRHMMQDLTSIKTMALRLKRVIQESYKKPSKLPRPVYKILEDLGSQTWKNGYKYGSSQPSSPMGKESQYSFSGPPSSANTPTMDSIIQENFLLRQQLTEMQHRLDEQDKTILRLQEKMNKTEISNKGKAPAPATGQVGKPRLGGNRSLPRPGVAGGSSSALTKQTTRGRSEITSCSEVPTGGSTEHLELSEHGRSRMYSGPDKDNKENIGTAKQTSSVAEQRLVSSGARAKNYSGGGKTVKPSPGVPEHSASGSRVKRLSGLEKKSVRGAAASEETTKKSNTVKLECTTSKSGQPQNKGVQSRLPSLNVRKVTRKPDQLQSFTKISKK